jgi:hypothetical protein
MSAKPLLWLACGLALCGCASQAPSPPPPSPSADLQGLQATPQAELADIRAGNRQQVQQNQEEEQNVINTIRYLGVGGLN